MGLQCRNVAVDSAHRCFHRLCKVVSARKRFGLQSGDKVEQSVSAAHEMTPDMMLAGRLMYDKAGEVAAT
jgi:hypothetical protein